MGKGSEPEAPAPPDYAAANREGIYADIETLPIRRLLDYASRAGQKVEYAPPGAEKRYNATLKAQAAWDAENSRLTSSAGSSDQGLSSIARGMIIKNGPRPVIAREDMITADFTGKGDIDLSRLQTQLRGETANLEAANQLGIAQQYAPQFQQVALDALQRQDPAGYAARQELAAGLRSDYSAEPDIAESATSRMLREAGISQALRTPETDTGDNAMLQAGRNAAMQRALSEFSLGGELSGSQQRQVEQSVRGAGAARGQALSGSTAFREVLGKFNLGEQVAQQRLSNLMNVGQQTFGQESALAGSRQNQAQARLQNLFNAQNTQFSQEQSGRQETQQQQQRRLSNLQSYVLGAPISSQFQSLQGAQQGASPYAPIMAQGIGQNANAGQQAAGFAGNIFGTQAQLYNTQMANSGSPFADIAGSVLGAAAGSAFGKGGMFGQKP